MVYNVKLRNGLNGERNDVDDTAMAYFKELFRPATEDNHRQKSVSRIYLRVENWTKAFQT